MLPVVCIHGALRSPAGMWPTAWYLRRLGFAARSFGYATRRHSLGQHASRLDAFIEAGIDAEAPVLGFLTHSMGGLVVRAWLQAHPPAADLRIRIAMLSPPNQGAQLARRNAGNPLFRALYGRAAEALASDAPRELGPVPSNVEVLILAGGTGTTGYNRRIVGDNDGVVAVAEMGLPGVEPTFVGGVHSWLQWRPGLLRRAAEFFRGGSVDMSSGGG